MASGVTVSDSCKTTYEEIKKDKKHRYVVFVIRDEKQIDVETVGERNAEYDQFLEDLQKGGTGECRYGLFDFEYTHQCQGTSEASKKQKLFLMSWCPDTAKVKKKMLYSRHGDLNKPKTSAKGRISQIHLWETLTSLLNASGSGDPRTTQQWKKVWSDLKNNTKKKAARIARVATGTGGGPALKTSLNDMEEKVLQMMGTQAATGLNVEEAGLPLETESPVYLVEVVDASTASSAPTPSILRTPPNVPPPMSPLHYINSPNRMVITPTNTPCRILPSLSGHSPIRSHSRSPHNNNPEQHATAPPRFSLSDSQPRHGSPAQPRRRHNATRRRVSQMPYHEQATADFMSVDAAWRKLRIERMRVQDKQTEIWQTLAQDALNLFREYLTRQA